MTYLRVNEFLSDDMAVVSGECIYVSWRVRWLLGSGEPAVRKAAKRLIKRVYRVSVDPPDLSPWSEKCFETIFSL